MSRRPKPKPFRINSQQFFLTYPKLRTDLNELLGLIQGIIGRYNAVVIKYIVARERHQDGSDHRHVYLQLDKKLNIKDERAFDIQGHHGNYQGARSSKNCIRYCAKEEDYITNIPIEAIQAARAEHRRTVAGRLARGESTPEEEVKKDSIYLFGYSNLKRDWTQFNSDKWEYPKLNEPRGIWYHGPSGSGKSFRARKHGKFYNKGQDLWWDGYRGEEVVILDDFDKQGRELHHQLKKWADLYDEQGAVKGGFVKLVHEKFIITSNYTIKELFGLDDKLYDPINRRFKEYLCPDRESSPIRTN